MDRELVERARAGDHDAFSQLARQSIRRLFVVARLILRDDGRAEDAAQETLVAAFRPILVVQRARGRPGLRISRSARGVKR